MSERELIYIGDPMCSWCFGFAPVMQALYEKYRSSIPMRIVVGGLRTGPEQIVDAERIAFLRSHWQQVTARTGQRFNADILNSTGWLYDTELACRAVVVMRKLQPEVVFPYFEALQTNFYVDNQDPEPVATYARVAAQFGADETAFIAVYEDPATIQETSDDFSWAASIGVQGFPSILLRDGEQYAALTLGYQTLEPLASALVSWLDQTGSESKGSEQPSG